MSDILSIIGGVVLALVILAVSMFFATVLLALVDEAGYKIHEIKSKIRGRK